jgi:malonate decarboxylase epsilon subunit
MSVAFLFPGQGSQVSGMLHNLIDHPAVNRTLDEISDVLTIDVCELDTEHSLKSGVSVQIALFAAGVATARALTAQGVRPAAVAGLSVGAFAAAVVAGVMQLSDAAEMVKLRAEEMAKLYPTGYGLSAIVGLTEAVVARIVDAKTTPNAPVFVSSINAPRQVVIAGSNVGMDKVLEEARLEGASEAVHLRVPVLSHCPLLQPLADRLSKRISVATLQTPNAIYVGNVTGRALRTKEEICYDLANNIAHGVRWHDATTVLQELGCHLFLEMPPGHTLSDLAQRNLSGVRAIAVTAGAMPKILHLARQEEANV